MNSGIGGGSGSGSGMGMGMGPGPAAATDRSHDVLRFDGRPLDAILRPSSVAVVGATDKAGSVGRTILWNLISSPFGGTVYPVNPKRASVMGIRCASSVREIPERLDLAVIVTPAPSVPGIIEECAEAGTRGAIVISAGFKEIGPEGVELERRIAETARRARMRVVGPNCLGVMNPYSGLNATFAASMARPGSVGFLSQSGALCTAILDWSHRENVGFSAFVSLGSMLDVGWGDLIDHLGNDPRTKSIVLYMETIGDARGFLSAAREVALNKPILVIKPGVTEASARAAASHTGSLAGSDAALDAAFRRCGALRVRTIAELFNMAEALSKQPRPAGPRLTIVTNGGGPAVLATDALILEGGELAPMTEDLKERLSVFLPGPWSRANPIDILGDGDAERYRRTIEEAGSAPDSDGLLVVLTPQAMTEPTRTAEALGEAAKSLGKPVLASWMGGADVAGGVALLNQANIPTYDYPDTAARMFALMWQYTNNLRHLYETPSMPDERGVDPARAARILAEARARGGGGTLTEYESKAVLECYGIPTTPTRVAGTAEEAVSIAESIGYPVAMKLHSYTVTHKTDVGGVRLNVKGPEEAREAFEGIRAGVLSAVGGGFDGVTVQPMARLRDGYELILGSVPDEQFGPVILFGAGGTLVEVFRDSAITLPPLNTTLARLLMERTRIFEALKGVRGRPPVDVEELAQVLTRFSRLVMEHPSIREIDVNPLLASHEGLLALDARVIVHPAGIPDEALPRPAIRPYPSERVGRWTARDGTELTIRPIRPDDEPRMARYHGLLSDRTVEFRYFHPIKLSRRVEHERLVRLCHIDYDREIALVAEREGAGPGGDSEILAVGRLSKRRGGDAPEGEFAVLVADPHQRRGIGTELVRRLIEVARGEKLARLTADIHPENAEMRAICQKLGFAMEHDFEDRVIHAELPLG